MDIGDISYMLMSNIDSLLSDSTHYKSILFMGNSLIGFDIINRMLIELQQDKNKPVTELKTKEEWLLDNRDVIDEKKYIVIATPKYTTKYTDNDNGRPIGVNEFNGSDRAKAIELGVIKKETSLNHVCIYPMYDIKNTTGSTGYKSSKPLLSVKELIRILSCITNYNVVQDNNVKMSVKGESIYIGRISYSELALGVSDILARFYTKQAEKILNSEQLKLLMQSLMYSISSLLLTKRKVNIELNINTEFKMQTLSIIDSIHEQIMSLMQFSSDAGENKNTSSNSLTIDISARIQKFRHAQDILSILEANSISNRLGEEI